MADSHPMEIDRTSVGDNPPQQAPDPADLPDNAFQDNLGDPDSGGGGEDYSSGSDRSYDGEDGRDCTNDHASSDTQSRCRRKRRHGSHGSRRQKGGSRHNKLKGFHPYPPKDEMKRKSLEIKEKEAASEILRRGGGEQEFVKYPAAPFNSTQFLMDEQSVGSPARQQKAKRTGSSSNKEGKDPFSPADTPAAVQQATPKSEASLENTDKRRQKENKEFSEIYSTVHAESLQSMPKEELVKHYMNLEEQVAVLQKKVAEQKKKDFDTEKGDTIEVDKESVHDTASVSDTNSLSSANEEFVDLSVVNQPTISVGESDVQPRSRSVQPLKNNNTAKMNDVSS